MRGEVARRHLILMLALATAVSAVTVGWAADSTGTNFSQVKANVKPSKLSKKKFKGVKIFVETSTLTNANPGTPTNPGNTPVPVKDTKLNFGKDSKLTTKGLARCKKSLEGTTTQRALLLCGKAKVGTGSATACIGTLNPCIHIPFVVTEFNGKPKGGKPTLILHSRNDAFGVTTILVGKYTSIHPVVLDVKIPPSVYNLSTITDFKDTVQRSWKFKGKKYTYDSARCSDKKLTMHVTYTYTSDPTDKVKASQKCTT
jgi:hypothetical protein